MDSKQAEHLARVARKWDLPQDLVQDLALWEPEQVRLVQQYLALEQRPELQALARESDVHLVYRAQGGYEALRRSGYRLAEVYTDIFKEDK